MGDLPRRNAASCEVGCGSAFVGGGFVSYGNTEWIDGREVRYMKSQTTSGINPIEDIYAYGTGAEKN